MYEQHRAGWSSPNSFESSEEHWIHKKLTDTQELDRMAICAFVLKWIEIEPFINRMVMDDEKLITDDIYM